MGNELGALLGCDSTEGLRLGLLLGTLENDGMAEGKFNGRFDEDGPNFGVSKDDDELGALEGDPDNVGDKVGYAHGALVVVGSVDGIAQGDSDKDGLELGCEGVLSKLKVHRRAQKKEHLKKWGLRPQPVVPWHIHHCLLLAVVVASTLALT